MSKRPYIVLEYNGIDSILSVLNDRNSFVDELSSKNYHFKYIHDYFDQMEGITLKTVIFEFDYIDKDYLEDYSHYYSRCFRKYSKTCIRLHFFSESFSDDDFKKHIINEGRFDLQSGYLGFAVLRPLPFTLFGKMCLKIYPTTIEKTREYPIAREYVVHLFGIELKVKSIAFQEQDNTISACATSALWTAFQATGIIFHHPMPSPYKITKDATEYVTDYANQTFPNQGLLPNQMAHAVKKQELEPLMLSYMNTSYFKSQIYAYLRCGIPIILGLDLKEKTGEKDGESEYKLFGKHAVTITGYRLSSENEDSVHFALTSPPKKTKGNNEGKSNADANLHSAERNEFEKLISNNKKLYLKASNISQIFVHDDQIGPFAKMEFNESSEIKTKWNQYSITPKEIAATPTILLFPLYNKIRIGFTKILQIINSFTIIKLKSLYDEDITWDIYLTTVCELKKKIRSLKSGKEISEENKHYLLSSAFPRYIWVADAYEKGSKKNHFSYFFDATDVHNGDVFICGIHYDEKFVQNIIEIAQIEKDYQFDPENREDYHAYLLLKNYLPIEDTKTKSKVYFSPKDKISTITKEIDKNITEKEKDVDKEAIVNDLLKVFLSRNA